MSPLKIKMLLHYYGCARDYRDEVPCQHGQSIAVTDAIAAFLEWELIIPLVPDDYWRAQNPADRLSQFALSDRGRAMVDTYMAVKLPVIQWVQP